MRAFDYFVRSQDSSKVTEKFFHRTLEMERNGKKVGRGIRANNFSSTSTRSLNIQTSDSRNRHQPLGPAKITQFRATGFRKTVWSISSLHVPLRGNVASSKLIIPRRALFNRSETCADWSHQREPL